MGRNKIMTEVQNKRELDEKGSKVSTNAIFKQIDALTKSPGFVDQHFLFIALNSSLSVARELGSKTGLEFLHSSDILGNYIRHCKDASTVKEKEMQSGQEEKDLSDSDALSAEHDSEMDDDLETDLSKPSYARNVKQFSSSLNTKIGRKDVQNETESIVTLQPPDVDSVCKPDCGVSESNSSTGKRTKMLTDGADKAPKSEKENKNFHALKQEIHKESQTVENIDMEDVSNSKESGGMVIGDHTYDTKSAGTKGTEDNTDTVKQRERKIQVLVVPAGVDPNDYLKGEEGMRRLKKIVEEARAKKPESTPSKLNAPRWVNVKLSNESQGDLENTSPKSIKKKQQKEKQSLSCDICSKSFQRAGFLKKHKHNCTQDVNAVFMCDICGTCCKDKRGLRVHRNRHLFSNRFPCPHCEKKFFDKKDRDNHIRTHTKEKPYVCEVCEKAYSHKQPLRIHMMRHQNIGVRHPGAKIYNCPVCSKVFYKGSSLQEHLRIHVGSKPYSCKVCGKEFRMRQHVKAHLRGIHHMPNDEHDSHIAYNKTKVTVIESNMSDTQNLKESEANQNPVITLEVETNSGILNSEDSVVVDALSSYVSDLQENVDSGEGANESGEVIVFHDQEETNTERVMEVNTENSTIIDNTTHIIETENTEEETVQTVILNESADGNEVLESTEQTFAGPGGTYRLVQDTSVADNEKVYFRVMLI